MGITSFAAKQSGFDRQINKKEESLMKLKKRIFTAVFAAAMAFSALPASAFELHYDGAHQVIAPDALMIKLESLELGDGISFSILDADEAMATRRGGQHLQFHSIEEIEIFARELNAAMLLLEELDYTAADVVYHGFTEYIIYDKNGGYFGADSLTVISETHRFTATWWQPLPAQSGLGAILSFVTVSYEVRVNRSGPSFNTVSYQGSAITGVTLTSADLFTQWIGINNWTEFIHHPAPHFGHPGEIRLNAHGHVRISGNIFGIDIGINALPMTLTSIARYNIPLR